MFKNKIRQFIDKGYFSFFLGNLTLSQLNKLEKKQIKLIKNLLKGYYIKYTANKTIYCDDEQQNRVFIFMNILPLWEKSTSNFLKIIADIANFYADNNIEVHFVLANHSHMSYLYNDGIKWNNFMHIEHSKLKKKIYEDIYNMVSLKKKDLNIHILNPQLGEITLNQYIDDSIKFINNLNLSKTDLVFHDGGIVKSDLFEVLMKKICSKTIFLSMGRAEIIDEKYYDYISSFNLDKGQKNTKIINPLTLNLSPFDWERRNELKLSIKESAIINKFKLIKPKILFICAKQKISNSLDQEFIDILNILLTKYKKSEVLLIGDDEKTIKNKLKNKISEINRIKVLNFSDSLYSFYLELTKECNSFFIFPRITGGGIGNLTVACANIPTTIFKGNDAENSWIPGKYFVETVDEYLSQIDSFVNNEKNIEQFKVDFHNFKLKKENDSKKICFNLLFDTKESK